MRFTPTLLRSLQERAARAQPVEHVVRDEGWWLRRTASASWWLASVLPHGGSAADLPARVGRAEQAAAAAGRSASFQISPGVCPDGLDGLLETRGYRRRGRISLQCAATADVLSAPAPRFESLVEERVGDAWFDLWHRVHGGDPGPDRENLERLEPPAAYVTVLADGEAVAVGRAVAEAGWTGLFGLATLPEARGRGAGRGLLRTLAAWAREQGTPDLYLQVESGNAPANALYAKAGFTEALAYHYRAKA